MDTTIIKVARFLKRLKAELRDGKIGVFELKECVEEIKSVIKTVNKMKKSEQISDLVDDLYRMKRKLCKQVDSEQRKIEHRKTLPKPILPVFNSDRPDTYLDFRYSMPPCFYL